MRTYEVIGVAALLLLVLACPLYAMREPDRMARAQARLETRRVADAADLYLDTCASCHGADGKGLGAMPPLNNPALAGAHRDVLYRTIANSPHGSVMAAWHVDEGGALNGYQVESLVTLIQSERWETVAAVATADRLLPASPMPVDLVMLEPGEDEDPHECRSCHEEPAVHAERFGLNCARCHNLQAWKPALLTRHVFPLDHGDAGQIACETCHQASYADYTCYGCHDHIEEEMAALHVDEAVSDLQTCARCHPTGVPGEADRILEATASSPVGEQAREVVGYERVGGDSMPSMADR